MRPETRRALVGILMDEAVFSLAWLVSVRPVIRQWALRLRPGAGNRL